MKMWKCPSQFAGAKNYCFTTKYSSNKLHFRSQHSDHFYLKSFKQLISCQNSWQFGEAAYSFCPSSFLSLQMLVYVCTKQIQDLYFKNTHALGHITSLSLRPSSCFLPSTHSSKVQATLQLPVLNPHASHLPPPASFHPALCSPAAIFTALSLMHRSISLRWGFH